MFDIASTELLLVILIALVVIGPKDLPKVLRFVGNWVGKARSVMAQFRSGFDEMVRESELKEMEEKWKAQNDAIMRDHPPGAFAGAPSDAASPGSGYGDFYMADTAAEMNDAAPDPDVPAAKIPGPKRKPKNSKPAKDVGTA